jgi:hypothetical protein
MSGFAGPIGAFLWHCAHITEGSTPQDSIGVTSGREQRRSRHPSRALLLFLSVARRTIRISASVYPRSVIRPPFFGVSAGPRTVRAHKHPTSLTLRIELEDNLQAFSSPLCPLPQRWARQGGCPREQVVRGQRCQCLLTVLPRKAPAQHALNCLQAYAVFRAYRLGPDKQEQVEFERVKWQVV